MKNTTLTKCDNCGAGLENINGELHCVYCGSIFHAKSEAQKIEVDEPIQIEPQTIYANAQTDRLTGNNGGGFIAIIVFLGVIGFLLLIASNKHIDNGSTYTDTVTVDTTTIKDTAAVISTTPEEAILKEKLAGLSGIIISKATFKTLYKNARRKYDDFSKSTDIYDRTSPQYINYNGLFVYITKTKYDIKLWFKMQYVSDDWLHIDQAIFNTDGENHTYTSWNFSKDSNSDESWEWYDIDLTDEPSTLIAIANAKVAKVKYVGRDYYKIVAITKKQKAAIKKQLQIYKGLLLEYDK